MVMGTFVDICEELRTKFFARAHSGKPVGKCCAWAGVECVFISMMGERPQL